MAGIAGIASKNAEAEVEEMLNTIRHRGKESISIFEKNGTTLGLVWNESEDEIVEKLHKIQYNRQLSYVAELHFELIIIY